ncbi:hypothetical protein AAFN47_21800 [Hoeflea sp. CAU 1731]
MLSVPPVVAPDSCEALFDPKRMMIAPLISNQMEAFQLGLGAALSFIIALIVMGVIAVAWRYVEPRVDE